MNPIRLRSAFAPLLLSVASARAAAQEITILVLEGDLVPGVGNVIYVRDMAVNSSGEWLVEAYTTGSTTVLLKNGAILLQTGDPLPLPPGASISSFYSSSLNRGSHSGFNFFLAGTSGPNDDRGVYFDTALVVQAGDVSNAPEFTPGTPYTGFRDVKINDVNQLMFLAYLDDPNISGTGDLALVIFDLDGAGGVLNERVVFKESDVLPGQIQPIVNFPTERHGIAFNSAGQTLFGATLSGDTAVDRVIYLDGTEIAQEGDPSPIAGRTWSNLGDPTLDLNDFGEHVYAGTLDGNTSTDLVLIKNGAKFVQEGDSLPSIAPFAFTGFGLGPIHIGNDGSVLWYGEWNDPNDNVAAGLFYDDVLLVQEGVTSVNGLLVGTVLNTEKGHTLSADGRYVLVEVEFVNGKQAVLFIDTESLGQPYCFGDGSGTACPCGNETTSETGCLNSRGVGGLLSTDGSASVSADDLRFAGFGLVPNQPALLFAGLNRINAGAGEVFGDGLRCAGGGVVRLGIAVPNGLGASAWGPGLGATGGWIAGDTRHFQAWYRDPVNGPCASTFNLTQGSTVVFVP